MPVFSKAILAKFAWAVGTLVGLEVVGFVVGAIVPWWLAVPLIGAAGAFAAYLLDEKL